MVFSVLERRGKNHTEDEAASTTAIAFVVGNAIHLELEQSPEGRNVGQLHHGNDHQGPDYGGASEQEDPKLNYEEEGDLPEVLMDDAAAVADAIAES